MSVLLNLISGRGVVHKNKPGETFRKDAPVTPQEDLEKLRTEANEWLPWNGENRLDKGKGWALNHPISKLIEFKNYRLLGMERPPTLTKKATKKRVHDPMEKLVALKKLLDDNVISEADFNEKKVELLAQI